MPTARRVLLVRHAPVHERYDGVCYGRTDVELGRGGYLASVRLAEELGREPVTHVYHSGLTRAWVLAEHLARLKGLQAIEAPDLRECDFGEWELRRWDDVQAEFGPVWLRMTGDPENYRPPGGESTFEMRDRVWRWYKQLPAEGVIVAVGHGGPIAALRGTLRPRPVPLWLELIPRQGTWVELEEPA
jgi:broad specificity phosphatase PhoE